MTKICRVLFYPRSSPFTHLLSLFADTYPNSKPLGRPTHNSQKFFLANTLEGLRRDEKWFGKGSDAIVDYWRYKNSRKSQTLSA